MFAIIVMIAIATSFMAPLGLRLTLRGVKMTPEERARIQAETERGLFDRTRMKTLIPTAGGPNALIAGRIATALVKSASSTLTLLFVESPRSLWQRLRSLGKPDLTGKNLQHHLEAMKGFAEENQARIDVRKVTEPDAVEFIVREASHGFDLIMLGAGQRNPLRSAVTTGILERAPCHVAIVAGRGQPQEYRRILVATNGSYFSRAAIELAVLYAEAVSGSVTVLYSMEEEEGPDDGEEGSTLDEGFRRMMATTLLTTLSPLLTRTTAKVTIIVRESAQPNYPVIAETRTGLYQLLIVGSENRAVQHRLKVGYDVEGLVQDSPCTVVVVVPRIQQGEGG
jgi:nucleotide-binding universal stress UspA family protein